MGNRAVITLDQNPTLDSLGIYLHWNGGPESVLAFAQAAHDLGALGRLGEHNDYPLARLVQVIGNFFGGTLSLGVDKIGRLDHDNGDNGLFVVHSAVDGGVTLKQYPRGLNYHIPPSEKPEPRIVNHDSVSTHPYWNDPETGEKEALLNGIKSRNAGPFGEWKDETLTDAAPELLAALQSSEQRIRELSPKGYSAPELWEIRAAIAKATTTTK
jgi:hypothetical protein